ncbi:ATP-binding protein [Pseudochrobactrum sp. B5]|uniref:ATP-binding protein n=1 Tax=Pseudochrobactrum sp. B5 TaxID=1289478 RepID=UPI000951E287|nr:ATP-binding protein [Pseudochrobactrum sp. B5]
MKITLSNQFKSVPPFDTVDLPEFLVIVGLNGTGKSQLLEAIQLQIANCDAITLSSDIMVNEAHPGIVRLTNATLTLQSDMFDCISSADNNISQSVFEVHREAMSKYFVSNIKPLFQNTKLSQRTGAELLLMPREELISSLKELEDNEILIMQLDQLFNNVNHSLSHNYNNTSCIASQKAIQRVSSVLKIEPRLVTLEQVNTYGSWGDHSLFNSYLPRLFAGYRTEQIKNETLAATAGRPAATNWLDLEEFQNKFGHAPWEELSSIMETLGLNYRFAPPGKRMIDPVVLYFERLDDANKHVEFSSLSAGEKVLVILAIALLNIDPIRASVQKPQLLLLDEIDASLHPAVLHQWMSTIQEKVVGEMNINCIMTTHSPVTVALAPEASLYEMSRGDIPLAKVSKREALNKLTVGLPSMEVDFTQRRQIFVEAEVDAQAYDRLHTLMKADLQLVRSLNFLSTGIKNKDGIEQGTGCAAVEKVVGQLASYGSISTFGLLDWDGTRSAKNQIHILAKGTHYAFDNVILNPLLVGLLLIRTGYPPAEDLPKFVGIDQLNVIDLQRIADAVQSQLSYPDHAPTGQVETFFSRGLKIMTDKAFCECNGHKMEEALHNAFPSLRAYTNKKGQLALKVIDLVIGDCPSLCPMPFIDAFKELSNANPCNEI